MAVESKTEECIHTVVYISLLHSFQQLGSSVKSETKGVKFQNGSKHTNLVSLEREKLVIKEYVTRFSKNHGSMMI